MRAPSKAEDAVDNSQLGRLNCEVRIVPDDFSIDTDDLSGWKIFEDYKSKINVADECLEFGDMIIPFAKDECFIIPPQTRQIVYARASRRSAN